MLRIRIRWIDMFLGLPDPHPDLLVKDMDPYPDPSIIKELQRMPLKTSEVLFFQAAKISLFSKS